MHTVRRTFASIALAGWLAGCVHESAADGHYARLQDDVRALTSERDRHGASGVSTSTPPLPAPAPDPTAGTPNADGAPRLDPDHAPVSDDPEDTSPRPTIKLLGAGGAPTRGRARRDDPADIVAGDPQPRPSALDPEARKAYDGALERARSGKHREGLAQMTAFLTRWPDHPYADNAMYWRAECMAGLGDTGKAIAELEALLSRFPLGNKVPDALAKLGVLYERAGEPARAKAALERLARDFPKSDAARRRARKQDGRPKDPL